METVETEAPAKVPKPKPAIRERKRKGKKADIIDTKKMIEEDDRKFRIRFPVENDDVYKPMLMEIPTCQYIGKQPFNPDGTIPEDKVTFLSLYTIDVSEETLQKVAKFGKSHRFDFASDIAVRAFAATSEGKTLERMSYAKSTAADIGLPKVGGKPYPFQIAGAAYGKRAKKTFIADEMGLGKTVEGCLIIAATTNEQPGPWLIVTPKSLRINWFNELKTWLKPVRSKGKRLNICMLRNAMFELNNKGKLTKAAKKFLSEQNIIITNYDRVAKYLPYLQEIDWFGFIFDESHYLKGRNAIRTKACKHLVANSDPEYVLLLSGTPLVNNPMDLIGQLVVLDRMGDFGGYNHFVRRYCSISTKDITHVAEANKAMKKNMDGNGEEDLGAQAVQDALVRKLYENMTSLNKALRSQCYIRREKSEVLEFLPEKTRSTIPVEITNRKTYEKIEDDVLNWVANRALKDEKFLASIKKMSPKKQAEMMKARRASAYYKSSRAKALVKLNHLKLCAAAGKMKAAKEWIDDFLESGQKLVVFCHHKIIQKELLEYYPDAAHTMTGGEQARADAVARFQNDKKCKLFIGSIERDGVGITLHAASSTVTLELRWNPAKHDQAEDRVHRIGQKNACVAYYLLASGTVEERIARIIERKRQVVNAVADGDPLKGVEQGSILSVVDELLEEMQKAKPRRRRVSKKKAADVDEDAA